MTSIGGVGGGQVEPYAVKVPDTSTLEQLDGQLKGHFEQVQSSFTERMTDLNQQIADSDDPMEKMALEQEVRSLERELGDIHSMIESLPSGMALKVGGDEMSAALEEAIEGLHDQITTSYAQFGTADDPGQFVMDQGQLDKLDGLRLNETITGPGGESSSVDSEGQQVDGDAAPESQSVEEASRDMDELVNMLATDPDAFMEELSDLEPEERNAMMMTVQTQLQQMNQLFQMTSQFSQAMHDTQSAIIQNMRV